MLVLWRKGPPSNDRFWQMVCHKFSPISLRLHSDATFAFGMNSAHGRYVARGGRVAALTVSSCQDVGHVYKASQLRLTPTDSR
jgi:hypothetical protein